MCENTVTQKFYVLRVVRLARGRFYVVFSYVPKPEIGRKMLNTGRQKLRKKLGWVAWHSLQLLKNHKFLIFV